MAANNIKNIKNIVPVPRGIQIEGANGAPTTYAVQMLLYDKSASVLVIATGTNATGEQMSLLFPSTANKWVLSSTIRSM